MAKDQSDRGGVNVASIDIGSHTARLLISQRTEDSRLFRPLLRERAYIRLAEDFGPPGREILKPEAMERAFHVLGDFGRTVRKWDVKEVSAVSTGVVRKAGNRDQFLSLLYERTGIKAKVITGEEEARLTGKGVLHSLDIRGEPFIIFDLGGGSTEFLLSEREDITVRSVPLGAMVLMQAFLKGDPPSGKDTEALNRYVEEVLHRTFPGQPGEEEGDRLVVGTGGTVTTLGAMLLSLDVGDIGPEKIHGLTITRESLQGLFARMRTLTVEERSRMKGLDRGRADVILAGSMVVTAILHFFRSPRMLVSFSDILEGILIDSLAGSTVQGRD